MLLASTMLAGAAHAQVVTWNGSAGDGDWFNGTNWTPPPGPPQLGDTALFNGATPRTITIQGGFADADALQFAPHAAPGYTFNLDSAILSLHGAGIVNNGAPAPSFDVTAASLSFMNDGTSAGNAVITNGNTGTTQFFNNSNAGSATIVNNNGGATEFNDSASAGAAAITTNAGGATFFSGSSSALSAILYINGNIADFGSVTFSNNASAGNAQITANAFGLLLFQDNSSAGSATVTLNNNGVAAFFGNADGGNARFVVNGGGTADFTFTTGPNNDGRVNVGSIEGAGEIFMPDLGTLVVGGNGLSTEFSGTMSQCACDPSALEKVGPGTLRLSGVNTFSGGTTITGGAIEIANTGALGTGAITLNGGTLQAGANNLNLGLPIAINTAGGTVNTNGNTMTLSGVIADGNGPGALTKAGAGTLILTQNNTYSGATVVTGGGLIVNGSIGASSALTVDPGALVGGTGILPAAMINGTLSPGNPNGVLGTITIQGSLVLSSAASYLVEMSPTAADRTNVAGAATLAGTLRLVPTSGSYAIGQQYVILDAAGGRTGTFSTVDAGAGFGPWIRPRVVYGSNSVIVVLDQVLLASLLPPGTGANQQGVAGAIDQIVTSGNGDPFASLFSLPPASLPAALSQLTGEIGTTAPMLWFEAMRLFLNTMTDPYAGFGGNGPGLFTFAADRPDAAAAFASIDKAPAAVVERRWRVWAAAFGSQGSAEGAPALGTHRASTRTGNIAAGADYRISPDARLGFAVAGGSGTFDVGGLGNGRGDIFQFGVYGVTRLYDLYLTAAAAYASADISTDRTVALGATAARLTANYRADAIGGRIEAGRRYAFGLHGVTPFAAVLAEAGRMPAYNETSGAFALSYGTATPRRVRSELGLGIDTRSGPDLSLFARAAWAHEFERDRSAVAAFQLLPVAGFTVLGAFPAADALLVSGGAQIDLAPGVAVRGKFEGEFASAASTYAATGGLRVIW